MLRNAKMMKITALNEDEHGDTSEQDEVTVIKEAQEAIAENEYVRAIKFKAEGNDELALTILNDLLETQVLIEGNKDDKLRFIKYNCYKNIAFIFEGRSEYGMALQNYVSALLIDSADVYTSHKFGQRALEMRCIELAEYAFDNCLRNNASHWRAADGMLSTLYNARNLLGSYVFAKKIQHRNPKNLEAVGIIDDIATWFRFAPKILVMCGRSSFEPTTFSSKKSLTFLSGLTQNDVKDENDSIKIDEYLQQITLEDLSWQTVGQFILSYCAFLKDNGADFFHVFKFNDVVKSGQSTLNGGEEMKDENPQPQDNENAQESTINNTTDTSNLEQNKCTALEVSDMQTVDSNNEDSDSNNKLEGGEGSRSKARRRCSDLHFLEQWGWHKNRRYSSRKKTDKEETEDTLKAFLQRTFAKYSRKSADDTWPFSSQSSKNNMKHDADFKCLDCKNSSEDGTSFQSNTQSQFEMFLQKLQEQQIDIMMVIFKWLEYISQCWNVPLPQEIKQQYIDIFELYIDHYDLGSWNQLSSTIYESSYRICMLFLELTLNSGNFQNRIWDKVFHHLCFNLGNCKIVIQHKNYDFELRLLYIKYLLCAAKCQFNDCLRCLKQVSSILADRNPTFVLHLPNSGNVCLNVEFMQLMERQYLSQIDVCNIPKLYEAELWPQLADIVTRNVETSNNNYEDENWLRDFVTMLEILLQSLWKMSSYEDCISWAEKCYHYAVCHYLEDNKSYERQKMLADLINFSTSYMEAIILKEGHQILMHLSEDELSRMVDNITRILVYQFEGNAERNSSHGSDLNFKRSWTILHQLLLREEMSESSGVSSEVVPNSFLLLFTAHDYLGKRQWCSVENGEFLQYALDAVVFNFKAPIYDMCRDIIYENIEQLTYCLFKYPQKKARSKHLEDHEAYPLKLTWERSLQIFDLYKPEHLPEFNSYKLESISSDMEQMLIKIMSLLPKELDPSQFAQRVISYIEGESDTNIDEIHECTIPYKIIDLYYLLGDFYFKNRDFQKATKFYTLDLVINPTRFDSWAGIALSKASQIETKLNGLEQISIDSLWKECDQVMRCFERCTALNKYQTLLWIEYGSFCYTIHSYLSRYLKYSPKNMLEPPGDDVEQRKEHMLNIAQNCFTLTNSIQNSTLSQMDDGSDSNDEKWLCQYMLGKIAEKRKQEPKIYLTHYLSAANYLYESNASYPIKINHSNPTPLSVEALEVFYRINAAIIKYIAREGSVSRYNGELFTKVLINLSNSPFAFNKAKIDGNSLTMLKNKMAEKAPNLPVGGAVPMAIDANENEKPAENATPLETPARRISQESSRSSSRSSSTSTIASTESSSVHSESEMDLNLKSHARNESTYSLEELKTIYRMVVQNIEECVTRFPEHYKSIYRLVHHFMYAPPGHRNLEACEKLLIGQYKTTLGNVVNGIFYERKNNNLFNGIWRIPSSEIDRPGSFSAHLVKCVKIFTSLLSETNNHKILIDIALNLYKTPDVDKRYIADAARKDLYQECISNTLQILRNILAKNQNQRDDMELIDLMLDIYKIHKKCIKYMNQKEHTFTKLLVEVYKLFIKDKVERIPENLNFLDLAIKLCVQEITARKAMEKEEGKSSTETTTSVSQALVSKAIPGFGVSCKNRPTAAKMETINNTLPYRSDVSDAVNYLDKPLFPQFMSALITAEHLQHGYSSNRVPEQEIRSTSVETLEVAPVPSTSMLLPSYQESMEKATTNMQQFLQTADLQLSSKSKSSMKNKKMDYRPYARQDTQKPTNEPFQLYPGSYGKFEQDLSIHKAHTSSIPSPQHNYMRTEFELIKNLAMHASSLVESNLMKKDEAMTKSSSVLNSLVSNIFQSNVDMSSVTNTLQQQSLAERQYINQMKELAAASTIAAAAEKLKKNVAAEADNMDDVIVLD
ncbi:calcineurin-binding protein cabin-1 [Stomoxys calcitrans]|uniref:calcineurin-binding protein cabin-1 n=1 Tax=Stomoxys calcitrans TaxID=35570 RepID=UPI0027E3AF20|nr:calcineurin-binding protein cabin-1 [Stomoxys calcitrans]